MAESLVGLGELLNQLAIERGVPNAAIASLAVLRRAMIRHSITGAVSLETIEDRIARRNPHDATVIALRCANANNGKEYTAAIAMLSIFRATQEVQFEGQDGGFAEDLISHAGNHIEGLCEYDSEQEEYELFLEWLLEGLTDAERISIASGLKRSSIT